MRSIALAAILIGARAASAQEADPPKRPEFEIGAAYVAWRSSFDFEASTATRTVRFQASTLQGFDVEGRWHVDEDWSAGLSTEVLLGLDLQAICVRIGATRRLPFLEEPWQVSAGAGFVYGRLDLEDVPGSFKGALGVDVDAGLAWSPPQFIEGFRLRLDVGLRLLSFDFDADGDVVSADDGVGGVGLRILAGAELAF